MNQTKIIKKTKKEDFCTTVTDKAKRTIYLAGDFNSRVGEQNEEYNFETGQNREEARRNNEKNNRFLNAKHDNIKYLLPTQEYTQIC